MRIGSSFRDNVLSVAASRSLTGADLRLDVSVVAGATVAHGDATGLVRRMTGGLWQDDGTAGGVTARASRGVEA